MAGGPGLCLICSGSGPRAWALLATPQSPAGAAASGWPTDTLCLAHMGFRGLRDST